MVFSRVLNHNWLESRCWLPTVPVAACLALLPACGGKNKEVAAAPPQQMAMTVPVTVGTATQKTVPVEVRAIGTVEAYSTVTVKSQIDGALEKAYFTQGQDVKKGQLLYTIDRSPFEVALHQLEANLARDSAQAQNARVQSERYATLEQEGVVSKDQYDTFRTNAAALDATVRADQAAIESAKINLGYCSIYSPMEGRTGSLLVQPGNLVKNNDTSLVVINQIVPIYVDFSVPEKYLAQIRSYGAHSRLRVAATIPGQENRPLEGVLDFINNTVDSSTGTIMLKGTFANEEKRLWPGQFVNVVLDLGALTNATVVPSQAVQTGQSGQYVFVLKTDNSVEMRPVVSGETIEGQTVIEKGITPGAVVVTDGQLMLFPGVKVLIRDSSPAKPASQP
ncbi:MAG TPA: efflux RND transporter periplasmic adaptor subunit [Terriglobia bacterium]|nr:efflux RND transporter periplasmic adaptor subunit [Terriglobia bacterium]